MKERLLSRIDKTEDGCWVFNGALTSDGYGNVRLDGKVYGAHRLSWEIFVGPIPNGSSVLHKCDRPACVNPDHLFLGTQADNVADMISKGRSNFGKKPKLLRDGQIFQMKELLITQAISYVATKFHVSYGTAWKVKHGMY